MLTANIIYRNNGVGLTKDAQIISELLKDKYEIRLCEEETPNQAWRADVNIYLELLYSKYIPLARKNVMIPNPEWFMRSWTPMLRKMDLIICKTRDSERIFKGLGKTEYTSFTSVDLMDESVHRTATYGHFSGKSSAKGTEETKRAFVQAGEFSRLYVYSNNVIRLSQEDYNKEFNKHQFHVCCSCYEGFGHYINEAKSVGAVIITTNAEPMNEMVDSSFGYGVGVARHSVQQMARMSHPNISDIAKAVKYLDSLQHETVRELSANSRQSFLDNDKLFKERFLNIALW